MKQILATLLLIAGLAQGASAQVSGSVEFNLFELEGAVSNRVFLFDEGYEEQYGVEVPVPFSISVPNQQEVELIADGQPEGGAFARFTFVTGDPRQFVENIQIVTATIPFLPEAAEPDRARVESAAWLLREQAFPVAVQGHQGGEILAVEIYEFNGHLGAQLIGRYTDADLGPMLLRLTAHPNPNGAASYITVANINLSLVPVVDGETLRQTLSGRVGNSLTYLFE